MNFAIESISKALLGGVLIGIAASILLLTTGRVAGISGITASLFRKDTYDRLWRITFVGGLIVGGILLVLFQPQVFGVPQDRPVYLFAIAGLAVGVGTQFGGGCTSGHGVCGLTRFSKRSLVATCTFIVTGMLTATTLFLMLGGKP